MPSFAIPLIVIGLAPFGLYLALKRPLLFPVGVYVMMVPFERTLGHHHDHYSTRRFGYGGGTCF